jgi:hypothetical protein
MSSSLEPSIKGLDEKGEGSPIGSADRVSAQGH